jgi:hypothetical protein
MIEFVASLFAIDPRHCTQSMVEKTPPDRRIRPETPAGELCPNESSLGPPACPVCGGTLVEQRGKLVCRRCHTICETCCEGGRG